MDGGEAGTNRARRGDYYDLDGKDEPAGVRRVRLEGRSDPLRLLKPVKPYFLKLWHVVHVMLPIWVCLLLWQVRQVARSAGGVHLCSLWQLVQFWWAACLWSPVVPASS